MTAARPRLEVVRATPDDREAIGRLAWHGLTPASLRLLADDLTTADRVGVIARAAGAPQVLGYAAAAIRAGMCELLDVAVATDARRQGVASALLDAIDGQARARGVTDTTLEVAADNIGALALYRHRGFVIEGRRPAYYPDGQDALIMWRRAPLGQPATRKPATRKPATRQPMTTMSGASDRALTALQGE